MSLPTPEQLRQRVQYDADTGILTWKERKPSDFPSECAPATPEQICAMWNRRHAGKEAFGNLSKRGYKHGSWKPRTLTAHRVAWAIFHGEWPADQIDHINGDRTDNRIANLRQVSNAENAKNMNRSRANKSGVTGVFMHSQMKKWTAQITVNGKAMHLGLFDDLEDAAAARKDAEKRFGFHTNHGAAAQ